MLYQSWHTEASDYSLLDLRANYATFREKKQV